MLITPNYVKEQFILHQDPEYGAGGKRYLHLVMNFIKTYNCTSVLDYGCGKGTLAAEMKKLGVAINEYDPGVAGKEELPAPADLVVCVDVMEHIEPEFTEDVIRHLHRLTRKRLFVDVATKFDKHRWLTDGRNSHQVVNEAQWWRVKFEKNGFSVHHTWETGLRAWIAMLAPK